MRIERRNWKVIVAAAATMLATASIPVMGQIQRVLGLDISAWQGNISQTTWNNIHNVENRDFIILRSSRGGTTGYYNQSNACNCNPTGQNTFSQRYDDPYFIQNVNRVVASGMFAGSYHFSRPDIIESTLNSGGIANSGTDEANHFIQMAGPWMRPGYLVPVHDFEAGDGDRTDNEMAQFCIDFSDRIYQVMGIRPAIYTSGNYANILQGASQANRDLIAEPPANLPSVVSPAYPTLWTARWPNQSNPDAIDVQNSEPKDTVSYIYGPWDDYGVTHPWAFWQYASTARLESYNSGNSNLDVDAARGGIEFLKDYLVPAVWMNDNSGDWSTLVNWNSGQTPIAPVTGPGQVSPVGTQTLPTPRLPGAAGSGTASGQHDTVILERPNANITITLSTGTHNIRKLYMREALNITGGSLTINYVPSQDSTPIAARFSGPVTLSGSALLNVHTLQVDANQTFTLGGGTSTFNTINLMPHATTPAKILITGNATLNCLSNATAVITNGSGSGSSGLIDLGGATRTFNLTNSAQLSFDVPVSNGSVIKTGQGTLRLGKANTYAGGTTLSAGTLLINNSNGSATGSGSVTVNGGKLRGAGIVSGTVTINSAGTIAPGTDSSIGTLTLGSVPSFSGTNVLKIDRNNGSSLADKIVLSSGTLNYGGRLVVSNVGAALVGGEVFTNFSAAAYTGAFTATNLPALSSGLNWYLGGLNLNGAIKVNRSPSANPMMFAYTPGTTLQILRSSLVANATDADSDALTLASINLTTTNGITLVTNGTHISYLNNAEVIDRFFYTISDGKGGSVTGIVSLVPSVNLPAAPSGLSAIAVSSAQINLTWTDNATNELNFIISRSQSSGGPYSSIATIAANAASYQNTGLAPSATYYYVVRAENAAGASSNSSQASATTPGAPPTITQHPQTQIAIGGQTAVFNVAADGTPPFTYRWYHEGELLSWTNASVSETHVNANDAGNYWAVVSNAYGTATSSVATVTIHFLLTTSTTGAGSISIDPLQASYLPNSVVTLTANPTGTNSVFNSWSGNATGNANPLTVTLTTNKTITANFSGSTVNDIILDNLDAGVTFSGSWQTGTSAADKYSDDYRFAVGAVPGTSNVTFRPTISTAGKYDVFVWYSIGSNRATNAPWTVVWNGGLLTNYVNQTVNGGRWVLLASAKQFAAGTNGYARLSNDIGVANKVVMADAIKFSYVHPPLIASQSPSQSVNQEDEFTFLVSAIGTGPLSYQWRFNNSPISGATDSSYTKTNAQPGDAGNYFVVITNAAGSVTSSVSALTVNVPPSISGQPVSQTRKQGTNVTFSVSATGTQPLYYQWRFNGTNIAAATTSAYTRSNLQTNDAGAYSVIVTNMAGLATSSNAVLTVTVPPPAQFQSITLSGNGQLNLLISGDLGATYWIDRTTNFTDWEPLTNFINTNGTVQLVDPASTDTPRGFYRTRQP